MILPRFFLLGALVGASARVVPTTLAADDCQSSLQILHLQDVSGSFGDWLAGISGFSSELMTKLTEAVGEFQYGVAGFVDKPIPYRGWGPYGNTAWPVDYCYMLTAPLSEDPEMVQGGFVMASENPGAGGDFPENPLEAMIFGALDLEVGWATETHSPSGRPYKKVLLVVTDDLMNEPPVAKEGIDLWNAPRQWVNETYSTGGWGSTAFLSSQQIRGLNDETEALYAELGSLLYLKDHDIAMTDEETARLAELTDMFGPYPFPQVLPHPGDNSMACGSTEYPSLEQTAKVLKENDITPIVLLQKAPYADEADYQWTLDYYYDKLLQLGIEQPLVGRMSTSATSETIDEIVSLLEQAQTNCLTTTTTEEPVPADTTPVPLPPIVDTSTKSSHSTSTHTKTISHVSTVRPSTSSSITKTSTTGGGYGPGTENDIWTTRSIILPYQSTDKFPPSTLPITPEPTTITTITTTPPHPWPTPTASKQSTDELPIISVTTTPYTTTPYTTTPTTTVPPGSGIPPHRPNGDNDDDDDDDDDDDHHAFPRTTTTSTTTPFGIIIGGGSSTGTIAGAAAGAAAGVAAIGAAVWKFGGGLLSSTPSVNLNGVEQMETPDVAVDREAMEEITMDMFN